MAIRDEVIDLSLNLWAGAEKRGRGTEPHCLSLYQGLYIRPWFLHTQTRTHYISIFVRTFIDIIQLPEKWPHSDALKHVCSGERQTDDPSLSLITGFCYSFLFFCPFLVFKLHTQTTRMQISCVCPGGPLAAFYASSLSLSPPQR